jgi:hypothetical protein
MRTVGLFVVLFAAATLCTSLPSVAQDTNSDQSNSPSQMGENVVEGSIISATRNTIVVRTDDNQFHLYTYDRSVAPSKPLLAGARVRVTAGTADENGTRAATSIEVLSGTGATADKGTKTAPVPPKVQQVESDIRRESRRWAVGVRAGDAFDPELFLFGVQSQFGPILHPRVMFRPNAEFAFGEVTDLIALNLEGVYRFSSASRRGNWTPYVGAGPALIFIHQSYAQGRDINFSNFDYETGFNVLVGMQHRRGTFIELKTSLWSGPAPKLRVIVGYNF